LGPYSGHMSAARPLRDVFDELAGGESAATGPVDPRQALSASGYGDLPAPLLSEAIVNYADTAPLPVAEQLAPFVRAHSPVPDGAELGEGEEEVGLRLLASSPPHDLTASDLATEPELTAVEGAVVPTGEVGVDPSEREGDIDSGSEAEPAFGAGQLDTASEEVVASPDPFPELSADSHEWDFETEAESTYSWEQSDSALGLPDVGSGLDLEPPEEPMPEVG
jgi:hypothetical protein